LFFLKGFGNDKTCTESKNTPQHILPLGLGTIKGINNTVKGAYQVLEGLSDEVGSPRVIVCVESGLGEPVNSSFLERSLDVALCALIEDFLRRLDDTTQIPRLGIVIETVASIPLWLQG